MAATAITFGTRIGPPFTPEDETTGTRKGDPFQQARRPALTLYMNVRPYTRAPIHAPYRPSPHARPHPTAHAHTRSSAGKTMKLIPDPRQVSRRERLKTAFPTQHPQPGPHSSIPFHLGSTQASLPTRAHHALQAELARGTGVRMRGPARR